MAAQALLGMVYMSLLLSSTAGLVCYECYAARDPQLCTYHRQCQQNEKCGIHKTHNLLGNTIYHLECFPDQICKGSESPPTFVGRRKREIYQPEVTCCNTDLCNHEINTIGSTQASSIELTTTTGCHDDKSCQTLKTLGLQVCSYHDVAVRLCPAMCNRCYDVTSPTVTPVSSSVTAGLDMTSSYHCRDKSNECEYLKNSLHICNHYDVVIHFGCMNTCGLCTVTTNTEMYSTVISTDSPTSGTITSLHTIHVIMTSENNRPRTFLPQNTEQVIVTSETTPVQVIVTSETTPVQHTTPANSQKTTPAQHTTPADSQKTTPVQHTTPADSQKTAPVQHTTPANSQKTTPAQHTTPADSQENLSTNTELQVDAMSAVTIIPLVSTTTRLCDVTPTSDGEEFVFMYATNKVPSDSHLDLLLASYVTGSMTIRGLGGHVCLNYTYKAGNNTIEVPQSLQLSKQTIENKGIKVVTSSDVTIHALYHDPSTTDGFCLLPVRDLSDTYVVPSFDKNGIFETFVGVTSVMDDTEVNIKLHTNRDYFLDGHRYTDGDTVTIHLGLLEAFELTHAGDVTGTLITSNHPIAVQSGSQCSSVPVDTGTCNHLQEMVPARSQLGSVYVVPPLIRTHAYFVRVIAAFNMTAVDVQNGTFSGFILPEVGEFSNIGVNIPALLFVNSSRPVLVTHYAEGLNQGEPSMTIIPPVSQYKLQYDVSISERVGYENHLSIIIPTNRINDVRINDATLTSYAIHVLSGTDDNLSYAYSSVDVKVDPGMYRVYCDPPNIQFGLLVYGVSDENAYEYPGGL